ncbi:hypothetical protein M0R45_023624 [Rubus argutus]|uniref:Uncharacterized protein n=1 Tax=Rubus argutus TaxID=59490 RepID=A0AAW1WQW7_RUBAR
MLVKGLGCSGSETHNFRVTHAQDSRSKNESLRKLAKEKRAMETQSGGNEDAAMSAVITMRQELESRMESQCATQLELLSMQDLFYLCKMIVILIKQ